MKQTPTEKDLTLDNESLSNSDAARRALDFYLNPAPPADSAQSSWLVPREGLNEVQANEHVTQLLRWAAATAHESANSLQGTQRDLALAVVHMINTARTVIELMPITHQRS
ncbi:DUF6124 family protein [Pseudomonas sp. GZD-222]|uniref:DUF6124 family protein n=1 Tax=Pseudomonas sp. GZD-222 TaxID=3404805 RepID=UPI003BB54D2B